MGRDGFISWFWRAGFGCELSLHAAGKFCRALTLSSAVSIFRPATASFIGASDLSAIAMAFARGGVVCWGRLLLALYGALAGAARTNFAGASVLAAVLIASVLRRCRLLAHRR